MPPTTVAPPGDRFNFAQHLIERNAGRPAKTAFVDEVGSVSYGQLEDRVRRLAAGLRGLGLKRLHHTVELQDTPAVRGMVTKVYYLVRVEQ